MTLGPQFDKVPGPDEGHPEHWDIDVLHSTHAEMRQGKVDVRRSRVILSKKHFPNALEAEETAYLMGAARGEYPTRVMNRL